MYLVLDPTQQSEALGSDLLFNYAFHGDRCNWRYVERTLLPPACLPYELRAFGIAFQVHDHLQSILTGAIKSGLVLNMRRLRDVCISLGVPRPKGPGKKGAVKKPDLAKALVKHLWPDCSQTEFAHPGTTFNQLCLWNNVNQNQMSV